MLTPRSYFIGILFISLLIGCSSAPTHTSLINKKAMARAYLSLNKTDGVNRSEALVLAQNELVFTGKDQEYDLNRPDLILESPNLWTIRFKPLRKTLQEVIHKPQLLLLIDKQDGRIRRKELDRNG